MGFGAGKYSVLMAHELWYFVYIVYTCILLHQPHHPVQASLWMSLNHVIRQLYVEEENYLKKLISCTVQLSCQVLITFQIWY